MVPSLQALFQRLRGLVSDLVRHKSLCQCMMFDFFWSLTADFCSAKCSKETLLWCRRFGNDAAYSKVLDDFQSGPEPDFEVPVMSRGDGFNF